MRKTLPLLKWMLFPLFDTVNQVCMKFLGLVTGDVPFGLDWLQRVFTSPYCWAAIGADVSSFLMWMLILRKSNLSFAIPFVSVQYITILMASRWFFHEQIHLPHVIGIALIVSGLVLVGAGRPDAGKQ